MKDTGNVRTSTLIVPKIFFVSRGFAHVNNTHGFTHEYDISAEHSGTILCGKLAQSLSVLLHFLEFTAESC